MTNAGHNRPAIAFSDATCVVTKDDIQSSMQRILDTPMATHRMGKGLSLCRNRGEELAPLNAVRTALQAFSFHHADAA